MIDRRDLKVATERPVRHPVNVLSSVHRERAFGIIRFSDSIAMPNQKCVHDQAYLGEV
jgi:predicted transcriptional regulator